MHGWATGEERRGRCGSFRRTRGDGVVPHRDTAACDGRPGKNGVGTREEAAGQAGGGGPHVARRTDLPAGGAGPRRRAERVPGLVTACVPAEPVAAGACLRRRLHHVVPSRRGAARRWPRATAGAVIVADRGENAGTHVHGHAQRHQKATHLPGMKHGSQRAETPPWRDYMQ